MIWGILQWKTYWTITSCTVFPVSYNLTRWSTMGNCKNKWILGFIQSYWYNSFCFNFFLLLARIVFHNFHLFESSFTCPGFRASGLALRWYNSCVWQWYKALPISVWYFWDFKYLVHMVLYKMAVAAILNFWFIKWTFMAS